MFWVSTSVTFGVAEMKSRGISMPLSRMVWAVKAVTCTGAFSSASERCRAVTITSPTADG